MVLLQKFDLKIVHRTDTKHGYVDSFFTNKEGGGSRFQRRYFFRRNVHVDRHQ